MASQLLNLKLSGLWTNPNDFSEVPPGSLSSARNIVVDRESIIESRRGFSQYGEWQTDSTIQSIFSFNDNLIQLLTDGEMLYDADHLGDFTSLSGTYLSPDTNTRSRSTTANKNLYFTTRNGVYKMTSHDTTPIQAGAPKALAGTGAVTGAAGWFENQKNVAYRVVWGYKDANQNLVLGPPSDRIVVANNAGATRNVQLVIQVPQTVDTSWFYQIYRSPQSADLTTQPSDELQQVYENNPTAGQISARSITVTDIVTEDLKQAALYTNSTQEGIQNSNWAPPFCKDLCTFKNYTFYANTRTIHRLFFNLISVGPTEGIQSGDTITIHNGGSPIVLTAGVAENPATGTFKLETTLTPGENVDLTAKSLVSVLNQMSTNNLINAYYTSGYDDLPGQILFEKRDLSTSSFYLTSTRSSCWSPRLPASGTDVQSENDVMPNRIFYSKLQQPEAVPLLNYLDVGVSNAEIERILPLRDGIIILKKDGIFRLTGDTDSTFRVSLIDSTVKILAPETAQVLSNRVYFLSDQGVIAASDGGAQVISRPIENLLTQYSSKFVFPNLYKTAFGISYESDHKYILFIPSTKEDTFCNKAFVFNIFTSNWTQWDLDATFGLRHSYDDKLYLAAPYVDLIEQNQLRAEKKTYTESDFSDREYTLTVDYELGDRLYLNDSVLAVGKIQINDTIIQDLNKARIIDVDDVNFEYVVIEKEDPNLTGWTFTPGVVDVYQPIYVSFKFNNLDADNPGIMKHFQRAAYFIDNSSFDRVEVRFESDLSDNFGDAVVERTSKGGWGSGSWGQVIWGGSDTGVQRIDSIVPQTNQRANWLSMTISSNTVFNAASFNGISLTYSVIGERFK